MMGLIKLDRLLRFLRRNAVWIAVLLASFLYTSTANFDFAEGRYALFMDEREVIFDPVRKILHPNGAGSLLDAVSKSDNRYGQFTWNSAAVVSLIPERIFGERGQIVATRMLSAFVVVAAFALIAVGAIQSVFARTLFVLSVCVLPNTTYFSTQPKPEPWCLFVLGLICLSAKYLRPWTVLFYALLLYLLGFGSGMKISFFPFTVGLCGLLLAGYYLSREVGWSEIPKSVCRDAVLGYRWLIVFALCFLIGFCAAEPVLLRFDLAGYLGSTWLNTGHSSDSSDITITQWVAAMNSWYFPSLKKFGGEAALLCAVAVCVVAIVRLFKRDKVETDFSSFWLPLMAMFAFGLPILISVQRLWGHYLWISAVAFIWLIFALFESGSGKIRGRRFRTIIVASFLIPWGFLWVPHLKGYEVRISNLASRSEGELHLKLRDRYLGAMEFFSTKDFGGGKGARIFWDPREYYPYEVNGVRVQPFWGVLDLGNTKGDFIVIRRDGLGNPLMEREELNTQDAVEVVEARESWAENIGNYHVHDVAGNIILEARNLGEK